VKLGLSYPGEMAILRRNRTGQSRWQSLVFLAILSDCASCDEILQLLVSAQSQHFLATAGGVPGPKILVHNVEQLLKFKRRTPGEDSNQFLSYQVRDATGECIFL